jgi:hypothetical protein
VHDVLEVLRKGDGQAKTEQDEYTKVWMESAGNAFVNIALGAADYLLKP